MEIVAIPPTMPPAMTPTFELCSTTFTIGVAVLEVGVAAFEVEAVFKADTAVFKVDASGFKVDPFVFKVEVAVFDVDVALFDVGAAIFEVDVATFEVELLARDDGPEGKMITSGPPSEEYIRVRRGFETVVTGCDEKGRREFLPPTANTCACWGFQVPQLF